MLELGNQVEGVRVKKELVDVCSRTWGYDVNYTKVKILGLLALQYRWGVA